ncbi:MAG: DUF501 domain-containing protein [Acidimicrobiia bacterium]|nr:DUF501 domain-containing protein [Acidimicrobiia bacterium]
MTAPGGSRGTSLRDWADEAGPTGDPGGLAGGGRQDRGVERAPSAARLGAEPWAAGGDGISLRDWADVAELLGRLPQGGFRVWVRHADGSPRVIRNDPLLVDGTPMPTRYWLVSASDRLAVSRLESQGGVGEAETAVDAAALESAHSRYAAEREAAVPDDHEGPRPTGGVGGTRQGVKCLHAHYAWYLAGGADPVGAWVAAELAAESSGGNSPGGGGAAALAAGAGSAPPAS